MHSLAGEGEALQTAGAGAGGKQTAGTTTYTCRAPRRPLPLLSAAAFPLPVLPTLLEQNPSVLVQRAFSGAATLTNEVQNHYQMPPLFLPKPTGTQFQRADSPLVNLGECFTFATWSLPLEGRGPPSR